MRQTNSAEDAYDTRDDWVEGTPSDEDLLDDEEVYLFGERSTSLDDGMWAARLWWLIRGIPRVPHPYWDM